MRKAIGILGRASLPLAPVSAIVTIYVGRLAEDIAVVLLAILLGWAILTVMGLVSSASGKVQVDANDVRDALNAIETTQGAHQVVCTFARETATTLATAIDALQLHEPAMAARLLSDQCDSFSRLIEHHPA